MVLLMSLLASCPGLRAQSAAPTLPTPQLAVAFFYAANPPWTELQAFDLVVVDPGVGSARKALAMITPEAIGSSPVSGSS